MKARLVIVAVALVAATLVLALWRQTSGSDVTSTPVIAPEREQSIDGEDKAIVLSASSSSVAGAIDQRETVAANVATQPTPVASAASELEPAADATLVVHCRVKPSGRPIEGVRVVVSAKDEGASSSHRSVDGTKGTLRRSPITNKSGDVEFAVPSGFALEVRTNARWNDVGEIRHDVPSLARGEQRSIVLELPASDDLAFHGVVVASDGAKPIAGATIRVLLGDRWMSPQRKKDGQDALGNGSLTTDRDGRFELTTSSWKEPFLRIYAAGYGRTLVSIHPGHETRERAQVITLERSAVIEATVLDGHRVPLSGVTVSLTAEGQALKQGDLVADDNDAASRDKCTWEAQTTSDGRCRIRELSANVDLRVALKRDGKVVHTEDEPIVLQPATLRLLEWRIGGECTVTGMLVDEHGTPVPGHDVWLVPSDFESPKYFEDPLVPASSISTDAEGRFSFHDVRVGKWCIGAAPPPSDAKLGTDTLAPFATVIDVASDAEHLDIVVKSQRGLYIRGRVLNPAGVGAAGKGVGATSGVRARESTDEKGNFVIGPLMPGTYQLVAAAGGFDGSGDDDRQSEPVSASAGDENVVLRLRAGVGIEGTVLDAKTHILARAELQLIQTDGSRFTNIPGSADQDGHFVMWRLNPGAYDLVAFANDGRIGIVRGIVIAEGTRIKDVRVMLDPGAILRLRYDGADSIRVFDLRSGDFLMAREYVTRGTPKKVCVPPGRAIVVVYDRRMQVTQQRTIEVAAGEEKEVVIDDSR
jgi:hypothetical protein